MPTSKSFLLDVNCWLACAAERHVHHSLAKAWMDAATGRLLFCRVTQMSFLRLITNPKVLGEDVVTPERAWAAYRQLRLDPRIDVVEEPAEIEAVWESITSTRNFTANLWTDSYLAAFAKAHQFCLVTLDSGFSRFEGLDVLVLTAIPRSS